MKTRIEKIDQNKINETILNEAGEILKEGGLVFFPLPFPLITALYS